MADFKHNYDGIDMGEGRLELPKRVTATSDESRAWFARGWLHILNYNHEEAIECFKQCISVDGTCMMALWGIAYSLSSNYNFPPGFGSGYDTIQEAVRRLDAQDIPYSELERDLIYALATRSSAESKAAIDPGTLFFGNAPELNAKYSDEMTKVYKKHPGDLDVAALYAESLLVLKPWALWVRDADSGKTTPAIPSTLVAKDVLEQAMQTTGGMEHPGILHLYCHLMELSGDPLAAMPAADTLRTLYPQASHLVHMASHIDVWAGQYKEAMEVNLAAIDADNAIVNYTGCESNFFKFYRLHNTHMAAWTACFCGKKEVAMAMGRAADAMLPPGNKDSGVQHMLSGCVPTGQIFFEPFLMMKWHVMIRFGMWDDILAEPLPQSDKLYATTVATAYYARGIAYASKGLVDEAEMEQAKYSDAMKNPALSGRLLHNNVVISDEGPCVLKVGESMLAGEIEYRKGNFEEAFGLLREAVRLDRELLYDEPWGWLVPAEHALGALLLEQGQVQEATKVFRSNLDMFKNNMWALLGLYQCLEQAGDPEAVKVKKRFDEASSVADVKPQATCFCACAAGAKPPKAMTNASACCGPE
ncbi:unnamed protein product [Ascophyllum nodosum]